MKLSRIFVGLVSGGCCPLSFTLNLPATCNQVVPRQHTDASLNAGCDLVVQLLGLKELLRLSFVGTYYVDSCTSTAKMALVRAVYIERVQVVVRSVEQLHHFHAEGLTQEACMTGVVRGQGEPLQLKVPHKPQPGRFPGPREEWLLHGAVSHGT